MAQEELRLADGIGGRQPPGRREGVVSDRELPELGVRVAERLPQLRPVRRRRTEDAARLQSAPVGRRALAGSEPAERGVAGAAGIAPRALVIARAIEVQREHGGGLVAEASFELEARTEMQPAAGPERKARVGRLPHELTAEPQVPLAVGLEVAVQPGPRRSVRRGHVVVEHQRHERRVEGAAEHRGPAYECAIGRRQPVQTRDGGGLDALRQVLGVVGRRPQQVAEVLRVAPRPLGGKLQHAGRERDRSA